MIRSPIRIGRFRSPAAADPVELARVTMRGNFSAQAALAALPPQQRACVVLRFYEDLTTAEIADRLGLAVGTV